MIGARLREERERLGLTQPDFAAVAGAKKRTLIDWEQSVSSPTAVQLAALARIGADVRYIVTGDRNYEPPPPLTAEEQTMLGYFRQAEPAVRRAAMGALLGAGTPPPGASTHHATRGASQVNVHSGGSVSGQVFGRDGVIVSPPTTKRR